MKRVNAILRHPLFERTLRLLDELEAERAFCRHDLTHLMDVARLMWIDVLEKGLALERETVYAAALLHDLGRAEQIQLGIPHEQASAALAEKILPDAGFTAEETKTVIAAIRCHRGSAPADAREMLGEILYGADKACRLCWRCGARAACNWPEERKNAGIAR
ncbi:MAG: HD domain-containing protein [Clostridia bacterium]|nr:HD domain-containing protein [Clostridia bacterium]